MERITIQVKDRRKARALVSFLETLDFVETVISAGKPTSGKAGRARRADFFDLAGLWGGREVSLDSIRRKAWPLRR